MGARRLVVAAASVIALVACGSDGAATGAQAPAGSTAPSTSATLVGGGTIDPEALSQTTPVALWFWAPG